MTAQSALPLAVAIPLLGGTISPLAARLQRRLALVLGLLSVAGAGAVLGTAAASQIYRGPGHGLVDYLSGEQPFGAGSPGGPHVLGITLVADPFGMTFALLTVLIGLFLFAALFSEFADLGEKELGGLCALCQILLGALVGAALAADTINLFVWFEVAALASYGLTGFFLERPIAVEAAFKMAVLTSIAGFAVFIGAAMLYADRGALNFGQLRHALAGAPDRPVLIGLALLVAGFGTKAGLAPFHGWLPDAHTPVPGAVSALFSALMVNLGVIGLVRYALQILPSRPGNHVLGLLTGLGVVSALLGALLALAQDDLKRLLAWDTVSQMGLLMLGFGSSRPEGTAGAVLHLINHALFKALLFLCAGAVVHATGITSLSEMGGILRRRPLLAASFSVGVMSIAGVPGFNGYVSLDLIHAGLEHEPAVLWAARITQVITVAALFRAAWLGFLRPRSEPYEHFDRPRVGMRITLPALAALCVSFGVFGYQLIRVVAGPSASSLLHPERYAAIALGSPGALPRLPVEFSYAGVRELAPAAIEIGLGLLLCVLVLRTRVVVAVRPLRRLHTGSVNDYAMFSAAGLLACAVVLLA